MSIDVMAYYQNGKDSLSQEEKKVLEIYNDLSDIEIGELRYHIKQLYAERKKTKKSQTA